MKREDDFETRRAHLAKLSDKELEERFWKLADEITEPLVKMGYENTTPAIERSVLLRMGFSSIEAKQIVDGCIEKSLLAHGAGNVVLRLSRAKKMELRAAGLELCEGRLWDEAVALF